VQFAPHGMNGPGARYEAKTDMGWTGLLSYRWYIWFYIGLDERQVLHWGEAPAFNYVASTLRIEPSMNRVDFPQSVLVGNGTREDAASSLGAGER